MNITVIIYIAALVLANLSVAHFGPSVAAINAFALIGLDLSLRDRLHAQWQGRKVMLRMSLLIFVAGAVSFALNPASGRIAVASFAAFVISSSIDMLVFQEFYERSYLVRSNASNVAGAFVDSLIFPTIAFGALLPGIVAAQFAAKVAGGALFAFLINRFLVARGR